MIRRIGHIGMDLAIVAVLAALIVVGIGGWRLSKGPVSLGFLKPYVEEQLAALELPYGLEFSDVVLAWGGAERPLDLVVVDAKAAGSNGEVLATIPQVSVSLALAPLLRGEIEPTRIELIGPRIAVLRRPDGTLTVGLAGPAGQSDAGPSIELYVLGESDGAAESGLFARLERAGIKGAHVVFDDRRLGLNWTATGAALALDRTDDTIAGKFALDARLGDARLSLAGTARHDLSAATTALEVEFLDLVPDRVAGALAGKLPGFPDLRGVALPLSGRVQARFDGAARLEDARFEIEAAAGTLSHAALGGHGYDVRSVRASGRYAAEDGKLEVEALEIDLDQPQIALTATVEGLNARPAVRARATLRGMTLSALGQYWPAGIAKGARRWLLANLNRGAVRDLAAELSATFPGGDAIAVEHFKATLELDGATVHYLRPLRPIVGANAAVTIDHDSVRIRASGGGVDDLRISDARIDIIGLAKNQARLTLEADVNGPLATALALIDHPSLGYASRLGLNPDRVGGALELRLKGGFPLIDALSIEDVALGVSGALSDGRAKDAVFGRDLTQASLEFGADTKGMRASGRVTVAGIAADVGWLEDFSGEGDFTRRYDIRARLEQSQRSDLGFDLTPFLRGPLALDASYVISPDGDQRVAGTLDLTEADLAIPPIDWRKSAGTRALGAFALEFADGGVRAVHLGRLTAGDLEASGRLRLALGGRDIERVEIDRFVIRDHYDVAGTLARAPQGRWTVDARGKLFDAAAIRKRLLRNGDGNDGGDGTVGLPPIRLRAGFDRVLLKADQAVQDASIQLDHRDGVLRRFDVAGRFDNGKPLKLSYRAAGGDERVRLESGDAGRTMAVLGIMERIREGRLVATAGRPVSEAPAAWTGALWVDDFVLAEVPGLAGALRVASLGSLSRELDGSGVRVKRLRIPFTYERPKLSIKESQAVGSGFGVTGHGSIDLDAQTVKVDGTLVPAYALNSALGKVPGLGVIFSGEKGGGLFAAPYSIGGTLEEPRFKVNALGMLAPGVLRNIFKGFDGAAKDPLPEPIPD